MKKQLKKLLLVFGFVAVATMSYAAAWSINCDDGRTFTYYSLEEAGSEAEVDDVEDAYIDLCL